MASITNRKGKYYVVYWFDSFDGKRKQKWEQCENYEEAIFKKKKIEDEVLQEGGTFRRKRIFNFMIRYLCPIFAAIILFSSVANAFGWISM